MLPSRLCLTLRSMQTSTRCAGYLPLAIRFPISTSGFAPTPCCPFAGSRALKRRFNATRTGSAGQEVPAPSPAPEPPELESKPQLTNPHNRRHHNPHILVSFFSKHKHSAGIEFTYNYHAHPSDEFARLCKVHAFSKAEKRAVLNQYQNALVHQFEAFFGGKVDDLGCWERICATAGYSPRLVPDTAEKCAQLIQKGANVNLVDLVHAYATGRRAQRFGSAKLLRLDAIKNEKHFPEGVGSGGSILAFLTGGGHGGSVAIDKLGGNPATNEADVSEGGEVGGDTARQKVDLVPREALNRLTHLEGFFNQYRHFAHDTTAHPSKEFARLRRLYSHDTPNNDEGGKVPLDERWTKDDYAKALYEYKRALLTQFEAFFGDDVDSLEAWQRLCTVLDYTPKDTTMECKKLVMSTHVNLVDVVARFATGEKVPRFPNKREMTRYSIKEAKYFPFGQAEGTLARFLGRFEPE